MTRNEKILAFLIANRHVLRWCDPEGGPCACMGCINGSSAYAWRQTHPDEPPITKDEFERFSAPIEPEPQEPISLNFRSHPALNARSAAIDLLDRYSKFLEERGYLDTDWRTEAPYAIDEFLKTQKP